MTHTVHPYAHRLGVLRDWKSRWFSKRQTYRGFLKSDVLLREYLAKRLKGFYVSAIEMERDEKTLKIVIKTSRPGLIIGRGGEGTDALKKDVFSFIKRKDLGVPATVRIEVDEVKSPESNAAIVAQMVAEGLEKRLPFRRVLKQSVDKVMANRDVQGVKIALAGRLGGADMARQEYLKRGQLPLQTFRADIDFAAAHAHIPQDQLGVKVWIYKGEIFDEEHSKKLSNQVR